jgi:hypothetical protein
MVAPGQLLPPIAIAGAEDRVTKSHRLYRKIRRQIRRPLPRGIKNTIRLDAAAKQAPTGTDCVRFVRVDGDITSHRPSDESPDKRRLA